MNVVLAFVLVCVACVSTTKAQPFTGNAIPGATMSGDADSRLDVSSLSPLTVAEQQTAEQISKRIATSEWLGPLAPVALSPFFGITCLSGFAVYGEAWLGGDHVLLQSATPLKNPAVFWSFLGLTILTSLPRLSKFSKPFAQAIDQFEAYAGIITLLVIRYAVNSVAGKGPETASADSVIFQAGMVELSGETLLSLAITANIVVINAVKFFFEMLMWITPIPTIDAMFEAANKSVCAILMAIHAFSPMAATVLNVLLLGASLLMFRWARRRVVYYRTILWEFLQSWFRGQAPGGGMDFGDIELKQLWVFPLNNIDRIPALTRCRIVKTTDGWRLEAPRLLGRPLRVEWREDDFQPRMKSGFLKHIIMMDSQIQLVVGRRRSLAGVTQFFRLEDYEGLEEHNPRRLRSGMHAELA